MTLAVAWDVKREHCNHFLSMPRSYFMPVYLAFAIFWGGGGGGGVAGDHHGLIEVCHMYVTILPLRYRTKTFFLL